VTAGIISKKERDSQAFNTFQRFLQTDAAINRAATAAGRWLTCTAKRSA